MTAKTIGDFVPGATPWAPQFGGRRISCSSPASFPYVCSAVQMHGSSKSGPRFRNEHDGYAGALSLFDARGIWIVLDAPSAMARV
jgi:hypothetical protein